MDTSTNKSIEHVEHFLTNLLEQLIQYNSIEIDDLKLFCHIIYEEKISNMNKDIDAFITAILYYITPSTYIYHNISPHYETNTDIIFETLINNHIEEIIGE